MSLQLDSYFYPDILIEANSDYDPNKASDLTDAFKIEGELIFYSFESIMCNLKISSVESNDIRYPYTLTLRAFGAFIFGKDGLNVYPLIESVETLILHDLKTSVVSILYGAAREFIATITARQPWGPILMPIIYPNAMDFKIQMSEEFEEQLKKALPKHPKKRVKKAAPGK